MAESLEHGAPQAACVLVVDDEVDLRTLTARRLRKRGYEVLEARDGEEGWEMVLEHHPAAMVVDVRMPRLDGISLTRRLREHEDTRDTAVVILTASVEERQEVAGSDAGADVYLRKPCTTDGLTDALGTAFSRRADRRGRT